MTWREAKYVIVNAHNVTGWVKFTNVDDFIDQIARLYFESNNWTR